MAQQQQNEYKMGATFLPGLDDYYMPPGSPNVVSPAPQRFTPEVPGNIQHSIAALELDSTEVRRPPPQHHSGAQNAPAPAFRTTSSPIQQGPSSMSSKTVGDEPNFSAFPKLHFRTPNVPPSHDEREQTLEAARMSVLTSSDAEMQLCWAEDALLFAGNCWDYERHVAQFGGTRPSTPGVEKQIRTDAINVVSFLAEQGHPKADFLKGQWLEFGKFGQAQNKPEAFRAYKRAAAKGYSRAEYRMGLQYESTAEPMKALQHYKSGEAAGDSASCYRVAMMSLLGQLGQAQDFPNAVRLIQYAAETADENAPQGAYVYGMLLAGDLSQVKVPDSILAQDQATARLYLEKAAFLGFAKAQLKMGTAYELCSLGCQFDPTLALHYMRLAARQGEPEAEMAISKWLLCGYKTLFNKNHELAFEYAQRAAYSRLATAEFAMGYFHEVGIHEPVDLVKARQWYSKAAQQGNADAQGRLHALASSQKLSKQDHEQVALNRIRSQYGSKRGQRPERFQDAPQPMPRINESTANTQQTQQTTAPDGRSTPYPVHDRPLTAVPYPVNDDRSRPQARPPNPAFMLAEPRSSFTPLDGRTQPMLPRVDPAPIRPPYRQGPPGRTVASVASMSNPNLRPMPPPGQRPSSHYPPAHGYQSMPPRTDSAPPNQRPLNQNPRVATAPLPLQKVSAPGPTHAPSPRPPPAPASQPPPPVNIGFSAPIDSRADHRNRTPAAHGMSRPNGAPPNTSPRMSFRVNTPSGAESLPASTASGPSSKPPPKKGPQTFEEMGVPSGKGDHDCVLM